MSKNQSSKQRCHGCLELVETAYFLDTLYSDIVLCETCDVKQSIKHYEIEGVRYTSLYNYADIRFQMLRYKESYDKAYHALFLRDYALIFKMRFSKWVCVSVPSRELSRTQRGFDHIALIFKGIKPVFNYLENTAEYDQSISKNREDIAHHIYLKNPEKIRGRRVVIVDDIMTSGESIKACIACLRPYVSEIAVLVISDVRRTVHKNDYSENNTF